MVGTLIILGIVLVVATIVFIETGDLVAMKLNPPPPKGPGLPFLIFPVQPDVPPESMKPMGWSVTPPLERAIKVDDPPAGRRDEVDVTSTVLFRRPADEPVQLLPGWLEIVDGEDHADDLRFFGMVGEHAQFILGREVGSSPQTVTLKSPTVSRRHAKMEFVDGQWTIANLSRTNPVVINNEVLPPNERRIRQLADGDRIELGAVTLRFHAQ